MADSLQNELVVVVGENLGTMQADPTRVRQVMLNLLGNAFKFTQSGTISLRAERRYEESRDWIELVVSDTGIGMSAEQIGRLFEEFSQVDDSASRQTRGAGLGLAISQRLCKMMGGSISVESEPGLGSTFRARLPADEPASDTTAWRRC